MTKWIAPVILLAAVLAACPKKEPAPANTASSAPATSTTAPAPPAASTPATTTTAAAAPAVAAPAGIASADGETSGVKVVVQELKRTSGGTVSLKFTITNGSDKRVGTGYTFADKDHEALDYGSVGGVQLVDEAGQKKYFVVRDTAGKCVCSQGVKEISEGETSSLWARFPAPPDTVQKITVIIPHFQPMDDVPISR
jgi:hypothetical protein